MDIVAIGRVVLTNREHIVALEPMENGPRRHAAAYPYKVRSEADYFDVIQDVMVSKDTRVRLTGALPLMTVLIDYIVPS
ncbi:non-homologous end joining protein Ku [Bradyrhizobium sp. AZCC 2262]